MRKTFFLRRKIFRGFLLFGLAAMLAGCATAAMNTRPSHESLEEAVKGYWELRVAGDKFRSFRYERVSLKDSPEIKEAYMRGFSKGVVIRGFEIKEIGGEGSTPEGFTPVRMVLKQHPVNLPFKAKDVYEVEIMDNWQKIDGRWYHVLVNIAGAF